MTTEWQQYWKRKVEESEQLARKLEASGYTELADSCREEAEEIRSRFLADAVIVELSELELRYLHGDR